MPGSVERSVAVLWIFAALAASCKSGGIDFIVCDDPCGRGFGDYDCDDPCPEETCAGECVPLAPLGWEGPALLYVGGELDAPACPPGAASLAYEGRADLDTSNVCPPCACDPAPCVLPSGVTAHSTICPGDAPGTIDTLVDAPDGWDGSCFATPAVPPNLLASATIAPVTMGACAPVPVDFVPKDLASPWRSFGRACLSNAPLAPCNDPTLVCAPKAPPPPDGFAQCILYLREGDTECPEGYPHKQVLYAGFTDTRECTECTCGPPSGGLCLVRLGMYDDEQCMDLIHMLMLSTDPIPQCYPVSTGSPLQSVKATVLPESVLATCAPSGGIPQGEAQPTGPSIFCCRDPPTK